MFKASSSGFISARSITTFIIDGRLTEEAKAKHLAWKARRKGKGRGGSWKRSGCATTAQRLDKLDEQPVTNAVRRRGKALGVCNKTIGKKRARAESPPVSPVARAGEEAKAVCLTKGAEEGKGAKSFKERELARIMYNRDSAKRSSAKRASKLADLRAEKDNLEAEYKLKLAQVNLLRNVIGGSGAGAEAC